MSKNNNQENMKKPFYKRWWFWVIIVIIAYTLVNSATRDPKDEDLGKNEGAKVTQAVDGTQDTTDKKDTTDEKDTTDIEDTSNVDDTDTNKDTDTTKDTALTRDNTSAELTILNTGKFIVGTDIPIGRYVITGDGNGNLFINNEAGDAYVNEILGGGDFGVKSVTTDIADGDTVEISGINNVTFTPAETVLRTDTLTTGTWVVGLDFPPGRYDISSVSGNGNLFVYNKTGWAEVNEILGGGDFGVDKVTADLKDGYRITIGGMNEVSFVLK